MITSTLMGKTIRFISSVDRITQERTYKGHDISKLIPSVRNTANYTKQHYQHTMDSFDSIVLPTSDVPTNQDGGGGNNGYCVVFQNAGPTDTPSNQDGGGGNNGYCVIA